MISLRHWIFRTNCRLCTPLVQYSMHFWERNCPPGRLRPILCGRLQRITNCRIIRCLRHILSVKSTDIFPVNSMYARSAAQGQKYTAGLPDTTVRYRTGTMERQKSSKSGKFIKWTVKKHRYPHKSAEDGMREIPVAGFAGGGYLHMR